MIYNFNRLIVGNVEEALRCAQSYLLLLPSDEIMKSNLGYYKVDKEIKPRKVCFIVDRKKKETKRGQK